MVLNWRVRVVGMCLVVFLAAAALFAQEAPRPAPQAPPQFTSTEVAADRRITFRVFAPRAQAVRLAAGDIPGMMPAAGAMTKARTECGR